jgi:hypothetical protein
MLNQECAAKRRCQLPVQVRSEELSVHLGSYLDGWKGDRLVEAPGTQAHVGGSASMRAATRVKPEQASKWQIVGAEPPLDRRRLPGSSEQPIDDDDPPTGVMGAARMHTTSHDTGGLWQRAQSWRNRATSGGLPQESEEPIVPMKPGNAGGGKGLWFGVCLDENRAGRLA